MKDPRYRIIQAENNLAGFEKFVADWIEERGLSWEPVGAPFATGYVWNQAMFYREPNYDAKPAPADKQKEDRE